MARELRLFAKQLLENPGDVGAVVPSGRALARSITQGLGPDSGKVLELGPGTGAFTGAILEKGVAPEDLALFEMNTSFCDILRTDYPGVQVINQPAQLMLDHGFKNVGAVVSSLPLLNMPAEVQHNIVSAVFQTLRAGGVMVQFTYGSKPPITEPVRKALNLKWTRRPKVWANLPPARVYIFTQTDPASC